MKRDTTLLQLEKKLENNTEKDIVLSKFNFSKPNIKMDLSTKINKEGLMDFLNQMKKSNEELRLQKFEYAAKLLNDFANGENDNFVARELNDQFKNQWNCIFRKRVLILDEAQDLNYYMYKIIVGLIRANYKKGNEYLRVIMVADPDQLIFEYENTDLDNDMRKKAKASVVYMNKLRMLSKDGKKLKKTAPKPLQLTVNYRNNNRIIDFFEEYRNTSGLFSGKDYQRNKPMKGLPRAHTMI